MNANHKVAFFGPASSLHRMKIISSKNCVAIIPAMNLIIIGSPTKGKLSLMPPIAEGLECAVFSHAAMKHSRYRRLSIAKELAFHDFHHQNFRPQPAEQPDKFLEKLIPAVVHFVSAVGNCRKDYSLPDLSAEMPSLPWG